MHRCSWVNDDPLYIDYHDHEWGKPVYDDQKLYEMFLLETFQAGLSWITILHKREAFKEAFDQFDVNKIAMYDDCKINELMNNPKIIRNSRKIKAAVKNAQIFIEIQKEYGSFSKYLWAYTNDKIIYEKKENETTSTLSDQISKDLKKKGMSFVGSITIYSYLDNSRYTTSITQRINESSNISCTTNYYSINLKSKAKKSLLNELINTQADSGLIMIIDQTGEIVTQSSLVLSGDTYKNGDTNVFNQPRYIGGLIYPFPMMIALKDKVLIPSDTVDVGNGTYIYKGARMTDHNYENSGY